MNSTTSEERLTALTKLFRQRVFPHGRGDEFAEVCAIEAAETLGATAWDVDPTRGEAGSLVGEGWAFDLAPLCTRLRESTIGQINLVTRREITRALTQAGFVQTWVRGGREATKPAPVRYRRVALKGHTSLGVCRVEDIEVAGVPMLRATTLCDATPRVAEFPGTSVYSLGVLTPEEAMDAAAKAATARAEQARRDAEYAAQDARAQEARRVARASALATVTVVGANVELRVYVEGTRRPDLLRRDEAEVSQALRAAVSDFFNARILYDVDNHCAGLEVVREAERVENLAAMLRELGFGTVTRLPDQPATESDE